jgi:deazaflavin-dependent oxidoreductase (nitroreductase family)
MVDVSQARPFHEPRRRPRGFVRWLYRAPILLFHCGLGALFDHRLLLLTHRGRKSGRIRETILEVVAYDPATHACTVFSGYGIQADWLKNIQAAAPLAMRIGHDRFTPEARVLPPDEAMGVFEGYLAAHPRMARTLFRTVGIHLDTRHPDVASLSRLVPVVVFQPRQDALTPDGWHA